jgi:hypothetical protein
MISKEATSGSSAGTEGNSIKFVLKLVDTIHVKVNVPKPLIVPGLFLVFGGAGGGSRRAGFSGVDEF